MVYFWLGRRGESDTNNSKSSLGMVLTFLLDEIIKSTADSNAPSFSVFLRCLVCIRSRKSHCSKEV